MKQILSIVFALALAGALTGCDRPAGTGGAGSSATGSSGSTGSAGSGSTSSEQKRSTTPGPSSPSGGAK